jgi:hypothetical protein
MIELLSKMIHWDPAARHTVDVLLENAIFDDVRELCDMTVAQNPWLDITATLDYAQTKQQMEHAVRACHSKRPRGGGETTAAMVAAL